MYIYNITADRHGARLQFVMAHSRRSGTELIYNFRHEKLKVGLATNAFSVSNEQFKVTSKHDFGFYPDKNEVTYFNGKDDQYSLRAGTTSSLSLEIVNWGPDEYAWHQSSTDERGKVAYRIHVSNEEVMMLIAHRSRLNP